ISNLGELVLECGEDVSLFVLHVLLDSGAQLLERLVDGEINIRPELLVQLALDERSRTIRQFIAWPYVVEVFLEVCLLVDAAVKEDVLLRQVAERRVDDLRRINAHKRLKWRNRKEAEMRRCKSG